MAGRPRRTGPRPVPAKIIRVLEYIDAHLGDRMELSDLAKVAGFRPHYFADLFKRVIGVPPHGYIVSKRVAYAQDLLRNTDLSISEIALTVGFSSHSHLADNFRRLIGTSPGRFRKETRLTA